MQVLGTILLIILGLIFYLLWTYPIILVFLFIACFALWFYKEEKKEQEKREAEREKERVAKKAEEVTARLEREKREKRELKNKAFDAAKAKGEDVCDKCKTIHPKRCVCGKCLERSCTVTRFDTCESCRRKLCREAEKKGRVVCWNCLRIDPIICSDCEQCEHCSCSCCMDD